MEEGLRGRNVSGWYYTIMLDLSKKNNLKSRINNEQNLLYPTSLYTVYSTFYFRYVAAFDILLLKCLCLAVLIVKTSFKCDINFSKYYERAIEVIIIF